MEIGITKMSSKGQIVIPLEMRKDFPAGQQIFIIKNEGKIILEGKNEIQKKFIEDFKFAKRTEEAWKSFERGEFISMASEKFFEEIDKW